LLITPENEDCVESQQREGVRKAKEEKEVYTPAGVAAPNTTVSISSYSSFPPIQEEHLLSFRKGIGSSKFIPVQTKETKGSVSPLAANKINDNIEIKNPITDEEKVGNELDLRILNFLQTQRGKEFTKKK